jgi:predicted amidohydrolase YtcJ
MKYLILVLAMVAACVSPPQGEGYLLIHNAEIITMEDQLGIQEAVLIHGREIIAFGNASELMKLYPRAQKLDLKGATVLPGIIDSHAHVHELGQQRLKADITGLLSVEEMVKALQSFFPNPEPGQWLIGQGWDEGVWSSMGLPDRKLLDEAFPNNPVRLQSLHGFAGFYNGKALELAGIGKETPDPEVGRIIRREDGSPTGVLETLAQAMVNKHIPAESVEDAKRAILAGANALLKEGITSYHEAGLGPIALKAYMELAEEGQLPARVYAMLNGNDDSLMTAWFERGIYDHPDGFLQIRSIKVFYDGSLGSRTALLSAAYSDNPKAAMMTERIRPDKVRELGRKAAQNGFQMAVHAIGDEANRRVLNIFDAALEGFERTDHRWRIEHAQVVLPDYFERAAAMRYISSVQSSHAVGDSKWAEERLGPERIKRAYAWKSIIEAGAPLILNTDLPGEPWKPMQTLYFAMTRKNLEGKPDGGWYPEQGLSLMEALNAMTLAGAHAAFEENRIGSLSPGKKADLIILDRSLTSLAPEDILNATVKRVMIDGEIVSDK